MHFNKAELCALACHPSHDFNKEGVLLFLEKQDSFFRRSEVSVERWCRLRGNLLFYFKSKDYCSEPIGVLVLENFQIVEEDSLDIQHSFTLVYQESSLTLSAVNGKEKIAWISVIQRASISYMKAQIENLLHHIRINQQTTPVSINKYRMDIGASIDLSKNPFLEMSISCDNLRCNSNGTPPNARVSVYISKSPYKTWILYAQTETMEKTSNPAFLTTVAFRSCDGIDADTKICFIVCDIREKVTDTSFHLGKTMIPVQALLEAGRMRLFLLSPQKHTIGFITLNTWLINADSKEFRNKHCHATPKHCSSSGSPQPMSHRRTQSLPPKLTSQVKQPSHGSIKLVFENPTVSTFRFHSGLGGDISVMEIMAEPFLCFQFPQQLLRLWITEEELYQEEINALGDLSEEWKARQTSLLNQHSTLINVYGIALSNLEANVKAGTYYKKSIEKTENSLEFCPLNLHLQRLFAQNESLRRSKFYDILTVGAFSANSLGFKNGGLLDKLHHSKASHSRGGATPCEDKAVLCEDTIDNLRRLRKEIILLLRLLLLSLQNRRTHSLASILDQLQEKTNSLLHILDPSLVDEAFEFLDQIRVPQNPPPPFTIASRGQIQGGHGGPIQGYTSPEQALEMELASPVIHDVFSDTDRGQKLLEEFSSHKCMSYKARLEEGLSEFCVNSCYKATDEPEPWDLIQLNIRASLICLSSKIKSFGEKLSSQPGSSSNGVLRVQPCPQSAPERSLASKGELLSQDVSPNEDSGIVADTRAPPDNELPKPLPPLHQQASKPMPPSSDKEASKPLPPSSDEEASKPGTDSGSKPGLDRGEAGPDGGISPDAEWMSEVRPSIKKLRQAIDGLMRTARLTHSIFRLKESPESSQLNHAIKYRRDVCFSQALTTVVTGLLTKIWCRKVDATFASILTKIGPLVLFEGLLSCYRAEAGRLSDMIVAVEDVGAVDFVMVPAGVFSPPSRAQQGASSQQKIPLPRITGTRKAMRVILPVPEQMLSLLPCSARGHPSDPPSFRVTPVLFNVGINEEATLAAKLCKDGGQYRNNHNNFDRLQSYYNRFKILFPVEEEDNRRNTLSSPLLSRRKESLNALFSQLHTEIFLQQPKNVAILQTAAKICRFMDGVRVTSCKSAKDRTAMSVTLEEVMILKDDYDLSHSDFQMALDCLRSNGTRLTNCEKNVGRPKYAFSSIQLALFPTQYKPPSGTFGAYPT